MLDTETGWRRSTTKPFSRQLEPTPVAWSARRLQGFWLNTADHPPGSTQPIKAAGSHREMEDILMFRHFLEALTSRGDFRETLLTVGIESAVYLDLPLWHWSRCPHAAPSERRVQHNLHSRRRFRRWR